MGLFNSRRRPAPPPAAPAPQPPRLMSYQVANLQQKGTRSYQEDSFAFVNALDVTEIRRQGLLAVVCDGMGGMEGGQAISRAAVDGLVDAFGRMNRNGDLAGQLREAALGLAGRLYSAFGGASGTTMVAALFFQEKLYWLSIGDSGLYLLRDGGLYRMNVEHNYRTKLYQELIEEGTLDRAGADQDVDGPRLTEFLGRPDVELVDACRRPLTLQGGDRVLLCSDGVYGVLEESRLGAIVGQGPPALACVNLDQEIQSLGRRNQDNYTALIVACGY